MLQQIVDLRQEADELYRFLKTLNNDDWARETQFKAWTVNDVVQHLHDSDLAAAASARDPNEYTARRDAILARREEGLTRLEETRERLGHLEGKELLETWHHTLEDLCGLLEKRDPKDRLRWAGPDMSLRMFTTARQMETWAHGQEIYDLKGVGRTNTDRIKNIAEIGVRTFGWTFTNRGEPVPPAKPYIRLTSPSGATWEWNEPSEAERVQGSAVDFCQVVTQVRNVADTNLEVSGDTADRWMRVAQCFAGPPEDPPAPGTRFGA